MQQNLPERLHNEATDELRELQDKLKYTSATEGCFHIRVIRNLSVTLT
jgi:hypothetical protein